MLTEGESADLCRGLYLDLRGGVVDRESAFDLSVAVLAEDPADDEAAKVAALALDDDADDAALAAAVRELLVYRYEPTFDDEPGWLAALEEALEIVKVDLRASGLPDTLRFYTWDGSRNVGVDAWEGNSTSVGIFPEEGKDPVTALAAVADDAQTRSCTRSGERGRPARSTGSASTPSPATALPCGGAAPTAGTSLPASVSCHPDHSHKHQNRHVERTLGSRPCQPAPGPRADAAG